MKLMLIEKYEENDKYKYYVERCSNILEVIDEIICGTIPNIFSYDDQFGIEILKEGNIEEYVDRMCSFYEKESKDYKALSELKKS